jgi:hypothetical protein
MTKPMIKPMNKNVHDQLVGRAGRMRVSGAETRRPTCPS